MNPAHRSHWLRVDPATFDPDETVVRQGVRFHVFLSPYDLPDAVRGELEPSSKRFIIEFRYVTDEPTKTVIVDKHVSLLIGEASKRLRQITVDVIGLGTNEVALRIDRAIDALPQVIGSGRLPTANFSVARNVFHRKQPELLATLNR